MTARGTLSGDLDDQPDAGAPKGTLSGDLDEMPGEGRLSGTEDDVVGSASLVEGLSAADLEIQGELGRGGMGIIWLAEQRSLGRPVAVKTLRPELVAGPAAAKFDAEALVTGRLEHPNIPPVHVYGRDDAGRPYLCMKLVKGVEWAKLLAPEKEEEKARAAKLDLRGHLEIIHSVCDAIAFAHAHGVIHRDLKPENVMVGEFGEVQVMDWGIALDLALRLSPATAQGGPRRPVGTPAYLPPEMALADEARMGPWTDVYLLGGMLYELLTGTPPHRGENVMTVLLAAREGKVEPPASRAPDRKVPEALAEIAMRALDPDPAARYQSAKEFAAAIDEYLRNEASLRLSAAAVEELSRLEDRIAGGGAVTTEVYSGFAACIAELLQARKLWSENRGARDGLVRARLGYAAFAIDHHDIGIAEAQLDEVPADHPLVADLRGRIAAIRAAAEADARRRRRLFGLLGLAVVAIVVASVLVVQQWRRADVSEAARARRAAAVAATDGSTWLGAEEKIEVYEKALAIDPSWPEGHTMLARAYIARAYDFYRREPERATEALEAALKAFNQAVLLNPKSASAYCDRGWVYEMHGDFPLALADYHKAVELDPGSHPAYDSATIIAFAERRYDDVVKVATRAIEVQAFESDYLRRGVARFILGDLDGALRDALKAVEIAPDADDDWYTAVIGLILTAQGRDREAAERLIQGVRSYPRSPYNLAILAYLAAKHGDLERAEAIAAKARAEAKAYARCFLAREPTWQALSDAKSPNDRIGRAPVLGVDLATVIPAKAPAMLEIRRRGEQRFERGEVELALADATRVIGEDPADGSALLLRARCMTALGHLEAAESDLELVDRLAPNKAAILEAARKALDAEWARKGGAPGDQRATRPSLGREPVSR